MISLSEIKLIKSLEIKKFRLEHQLFVVEGEKLVDEVLSSDFRVKEIYATDEFISNKNFPIRRISEKELSRISFFKTPNKVLAVVEIPSNDGLDDIIESYNLGLTIGLDGVGDPGNMGTIIRIANWYGVNYLFCSEDCVDCYAPKVVQSSMGALFRTKIIYGSLQNFIIQLKSKFGVSVYSTELGGGSIYSHKIMPKSMLIFGSESHGVRSSISELADYKILIPSYPPENSDMESLNVGVAVGITCSEFRRENIISRKG